MKWITLCGAVELCDTVSGKWNMLLYTVSTRLGCRYMSLGDVAFYANMGRFQGSVLLWPHLCMLSVLKGGGGSVGYIWKALEKGYLEHPGPHAALMFEIFICFG